MESTFIKAAYLSHMNDHLEVQPYEGGHLVWVPSRYSDDDAVCLTVRPVSNGWLVTDEGSTLARLQNLGAALDSKTFRDAWADLARPRTGYVPSAGEHFEIAAWGDEDEVGGLVATVADACLRAEGLSHMAEGHRSGPSFSTKVAHSVQHALRNTVDVTIKRNGKVGLVSGGHRQVTATVLRGKETVLAVQALGGKDRDGRLRSHDVAYATFGPSTLPKSQRLAIPVGRPETWDRYLIKDLEDVAEVRFFDAAPDLSGHIAGLVASEPALRS